MKKIRGIARIGLVFSVVLMSVVECSKQAQANERLFTYSYEADALPAGTFEVEQWITNQNGRKEGDYSRWDFRTELEYGVSERYTTAFYLNWESTRIGGGSDQEDDTSTEFKGISWENTYQILNPNLDPIGLAPYIEVTTDGVDYELEGKILLSKTFDNVVLAANAVYEAEFEKEDGKTEKEAELQFVLGAAYKLTPRWSVGIEGRHKSAYPDGLNLSGREYQAISVGPNVHYGNERWWATLTVLPQVWGDGDGASGGRQLEHEEEIEVRLIAGIVF